MQARVGKALDLVDVVRRHQLARPGLGEVAQPAHVAQILRRQPQVARLPRVGGRKRRVRLIQDAGTDADLDHGADHLRRIGRGGQLAPARIEPAQLGHAVGGRGLEHVGALEVVVLQRRLDDLVKEGGLVLAVRLHRIEMLRALGEGGVQDVGAAVLRRIRVVQGCSAPRQKARCQHRHQCARHAALSAAKAGGNTRGRTVESTAEGAREALGPAHVRARETSGARILAGFAH